MRRSLLLCMFFLALLLCPVSTRAGLPVPVARWHTFTSANGLAGNIVQALWEDPQGGIWFGTENGVSRYAGHTWTTYRTGDGLLNNNVWSISGDTNAVWFATNSGLSVLRDGVWTSYTTRDGLPGNDVRAVLVAADGTVWVGTFGRGIGRKQPGSAQWEQFIPPGAARGAGDFVQAIWQAPSGAIWLSTNGFGALRLDARGLERFSFRLGSRNTVWSVGAATGSDLTWLATLRGIMRIAPDDSVTAVEERVQGVSIADNEILAVAGGQADDLWFGTRANGVLHLADGTWERFTSRDGLSSNYVQTILVDRRGRAWFGTRGGGVTLRDPYPLPLAALRPTVTTQDIRRDDPLPLTNARLNHDQNNLRFRFTLETAWLPPQEIRFRYWLERVGDPQPPMRQLVQSTPTTPATALSEVFVDLRPGEYILHVVPQIGQVNPVTGPAQHYPFTIRSAPPLLTSDALNVSVNNTRIAQGLTLPQTLFGTTRPVLLEFAADDDTTPRAELRYEYRVPTLSPAWQPATGAQTLIDLPRGTHTIAVRARDAEGHPSDPVTVTVIVPPPLWATILFYLGLILVPSLLSATIGALGYRRWSRHQALRRAVSGHFIPYDVGPLITVPDRYIGRRHVLDTILGKIDNNSFYIYGEKRIGKTSLLLQLKQLLKQRNLIGAAAAAPQTAGRTYLPVFRNIQDLPQAQFWLYLVRSIAAEVAYAPPILAAHTGLEASYDDFDAESDLECLIAHLRTGDDPRQPCIVLLLDEVDTLQRYDPAIRQRFRAFCQHVQRHVRVVLAGVLPPHAETGETSPWYNIFERITLGPLAQADILHLIRTYNHNPYSYTTEAEQAILQAGDGKPFDTQWLCSEAVKAMLATRRSRVTLADVTHAIQVIVSERNGEYIAIWQQLSPDVRATLRGNISQAATLPPEQLTHSAEQLLDSGILLKTPGGYRVTMLFQHWLTTAGRATADG